MSNTYTQIHMHLVFAVKYRECLLHKNWRDELYKYITGIVQAQSHKMLAINGVSDHVHIHTGMRPTQSVADLMQDIRALLPNGLMKGTSHLRNLNGKADMVHLPAHYHMQKM